MISTKDIRNKLTGDTMYGERTSQFCRDYSTDVKSNIKYYLVRCVKIHGTYDDWKEARDTKTVGTVTNDLQSLIDEMVASCNLPGYIGTNGGIHYGAWLPYWSWHNNDLREAHNGDKAFIHGEVVLTETKNGGSRTDLKKCMEEFVSKAKEAGYIIVSVETRYATPYKYRDKESFYNYFGSNHKDGYGNEVDFGDTIVATHYGSYGAPLIGKVLYRTKKYICIKPVSSDYTTLVSPDRSAVINTEVGKQLLQFKL